MSIRPPDPGLWCRLQLLHLRAQEWADTLDNEAIDPRATERAETRLLVALADLELQAIPDAPRRSMFDQSWTPRDEQLLHPSNRSQRDLAESIQRLEDLANEGAA